MVFNLDHRGGRPWPGDLSPLVLQAFYRLLDASGSAECPIKIKLLKEHVRFESHCDIEGAFDEVVHVGDGRRIVMSRLET